MIAIPNDQLSPADIPASDADWSEIEEFALTFDAAEHWGSLEKCAEIGRAPDRNDLTELRTALYFQQRKFRWNGYDPEGEELMHVQELVSDIRSLIEDLRRSGD